MKKILFYLLVSFAFPITSPNAQETIPQETAPQETVSQGTILQVPAPQETAPEEYIVEKKDTLWDISSRKLQDHFLWPKLWNVNPHIKNPDLIYPGTKILIPSREQLMRMTTLPAEEIPAPAPAEETPVTAPAEETPVTEKEAVKKSESKTIWKYTPKKKYILEKDLFIASGWIADTFPGIGEITSSPANQQMSSKGDILYIKLAEPLSPEEQALNLPGNGESITNKRYFAIRDIKTVKHPVSGKWIGHQIRVAGILEVDGMDGNTIKARVTDSFEDVQIGDGLLPYQELEPPVIPATVRTPDIQGYIVESHMNSYLVSKGNIVFLDKGENDGIKVGDVFSVLREEPAKRPIGKIQIVSLQPSTSGAVILENTQEIKIGTKWGQK